LIQKNNSVDPDLPRFWPTSLDTQYLDRPNNNVLSFSTHAYGNQFKDTPPPAPEDEKCVNNLIETFAGWCLVHAARFRRFIVITSVSTENRSDRWSHVDFYSVLQFFNSFKVDYQRLYKEIMGEDKATSASSSQLKTQ
jgi:hypothetical protein